VIQSRPSTKSFEVFLSHHKAGAGSAARMLACILEGEIKGKCFLDAEYLEDLDDLFDAVRCSKNIVVILSGATLTRPWCVGEVVTAFKCNIHMVRVTFQQDYGQPLDVLLGLQGEELDAAMRDICNTLGTFGINDCMINDALRGLLQATLVHINVGCSTINSDVDRLMAKLEGIRRGTLRMQPWLEVGQESQMTDGGASDGCVSKTMSLDSFYVYISGDPDDLEAICTSRVLKMKLQKIMQVRVFIDTDCSDPVVRSTLKRMDHGRVIVLVTQHTFVKPRQLARLVILLRNPCVHVLPVLAASGSSFTFPTQAVLESIVETGQPLAPTCEEAQRMLSTMSFAPVGLDEVASVIKLLCKRIMERFDAAMESNKKLDAVADSLAATLKAMEVDAPRRSILATSSMRGDEVVPSDDESTDDDDALHVEDFRESSSLCSSMKRPSIRSTSKTSNRSPCTTTVLPIPTVVGCSSEEPMEIV